ncbi:SigB/SigF/SigG family RNA polymerase sigma factor [Actinospica durhamensis]|uniref:SigB/SigF/SigG family RNA polymerase sigma factor n=1 Tax=Actinospica durhamensis TaxID=1508375 RepID=A0A941EUL0_9ACTN|nr:SigB/SigF/SigG family RNA polymerase sigma factor [Actinospica durhamensis]MBR7837518.1 SigB/SigF/SigG family RNA polymerase sigma factor [Actinospica durhamensis]
MGRDAWRADTMRALERMAALPDGDTERAALRDAVIREHMGYARGIALRYGRRGGPAEDLVQVAYLGLVKAVDHFDPARGVGFLAYATPTIVGEIRRYYRDATWDVHVARGLRELAVAVHGAADELTARLGRQPTLAELAAHLEVEHDEVVEALDASSAYTAASLDGPCSADGSSELGELLGHTDPGFDAVVDHEVLKAQVAALPERDKRILLLRFFRGRTLAQIGAELDVSPMQVSRLLARILARLRQGFDLREEPRR